MKITLNSFLEVSGQQKPLTYSPALDTLSPKQIEAAREDARIRKIMLDNVNIWNPNDYIYSWMLSVVSADLRELGR